MRWLLTLFEKGGRRTLVTIAVINIAGAIYGWYYYRYQLMASPLQFWPFIPDCPNSAILVAISLLLLMRGKRVDELFYLSSCSAMKYGIWTCFVIIYYRWYFLSPIRRLLYVSMFISHALLAIEAIPLARVVRFKRGCAYTLSWLFLNDFMDYALGTHPYLPSSGEVMAAVTPILTALSSIACYRLSQK